MVPEDEAVDPFEVTLGPTELDPEGGELPSRVDGVTARSARAPSTAAAPRSLGRYTLLGVLGRGGMGVVHDARDEQVGRQVALKLLHAELDGRHAERMIREARALARLSHPNVVSVYEVGKHGDRWFIAMERIDGRTLRDWQRDHPSWRECTRVYLQAGRGLAAAHAAGMTHRDFKPSNCVLDERGRVRVLDFGLARQAGDAENDSLEPLANGSQLSSHEPAVGSLTRTGEVLGTLGYMPLEQLEGKQADARSDQWSFCASFYEALYGERPIVEDSIGALTLALMRDEVKQAPKGSDVPRRLRRVLLRGLAKDPRARWPSMDALLAALAAIEKARRTRWTLAAGAMLIVAVGLAIELLPRADPRVGALADAPDAPRLAAEDGQPPSPLALELRERAEEHYAADRFATLREDLEHIAPGESRPDDPSLAAEVLLWRGRLAEDAKDAERGAAFLRKAYFLAQEADVPATEARAAGALTRNMVGAHTEGVDEWLRLAWVAVERTPWDRSAAIEVATTAAHSVAQTWPITGGKEHARALLEFADATVGAVELEDDAFVAWQILLLSIGWRYIDEHERALYWGLAARSLLSAVAGPEHPAWAKANEQVGRAIHPDDRYDHCEEALRYFDEALIGYLDQDAGEDAAAVRLEITGCLWQLGQLESALEHARLAGSYWNDHEPLFMTRRQSAHLLAGHLLAELGRIDEAELEYERSLTLVDLDGSEGNRSEAKRALERLRRPTSEPEPK
jgi:tRNA A-37 threonylcarbamoyl transferase component Bud32